MKTIKKTTYLLTMLLILHQLNASAQLRGTDRIGAILSKYSKLRTQGLLNPNAQFPKAMGVYQANILPASALEVNTKLNYMPTPTMFYLRGEVFRTDCPNGDDTYWRMLRGGSLKGSIYNLAANNDLTIQASAGNLVLYAPNGKVIVQDELVLKAAGTEKYYTLTVNKRGKLKAKRINLETVEPTKIMASN